MELNSKLNTLYPNNKYALPVVECLKGKLRLADTTLTQEPAADATNVNPYLELKLGGDVQVNPYHELKLGGDARLPASQPKQLGQSLQSRRGRSPPKEQPARADEGAKMTVEEYDEIERLRKAQQSGQRKMSPGQTKQHTDSQPLMKSLEQGFGAKAGKGNL